MKTINLDSNLIESKDKDKKSKKKKATSAPKNNKIKNDKQETKPKKKDKNSPKNKKKFLKDLIRKYKALKPIPKILVTVALCAAIAGLGAGITYWLIIRDDKDLNIKFPEHVTAKEPKHKTFRSIQIPNPDPPRDQVNPINGELYTVKEMEEIKSRYPIAVMVENHIDARNQSGYNCADIVFEALAEGGITRTMPIFWGRQCEEIGPIRSARQYFIEWLMPYDPLYMYIGYAVADDPRANAGGSLYEYGIKRMDRSGTFWRSNKKYAPHNAYTSSELLFERAEAFGYTGKPAEIKPWKFKKDAPPDQRGNKEKAEITFFQRLNNGGTYDEVWQYDKERNIYLRYQAHNMEPYKDAFTDQIVYAKNLIILRSQTTSTYNAKAHLIIDTIGDGNGVLMRDGHVFNITWKKKDLESRVRFYDEENKEIELNRGICWIISVPIDQGSVKI